MKIAVVGGSKKFKSFLSEALAEPFLCFENVIDAADHIGDSQAVLFILPFYDRNEYCIPEFTEDEHTKIVSLIDKGKTKIYIENYPSYDYRDCFVFGLQAVGLLNNVGKNSIRLCESSSCELGFDLLQKSNGFYFPCKKHTNVKYDMLAEIAPCLGVHKISAERCKAESIALIKTETNVWCSMADLTNLKDYEIFSYKNWTEFYQYVFGQLLEVDHDVIGKAFRSVFKKIETHCEQCTVNLKGALENAVKDSLFWHINSGVLLNDGKQGVYEMIRSFDMNIAKNLRGDSSLFTAALFMAAGQYFGNESYCTIAENIADYMLNCRHLQIESGKNAGLFKWFSGTFDIGTRSVYISDTSRVANSIFTLYKLTGNEEYKERLILCAESILNWFGGEALLPGCNLQYDIDDVESIQNRERKSCVEFYDAPMLFLRNLYSITGDDRYRCQILKTAGYLAQIYPNYQTVTSLSDNFTYSRLLCVFAVAETIESGPWTPLIDLLLEHFKKIQHPSGGFAEEKAYQSRIPDMEFAVGFDVSEGIADMVYCQNTMAYTLNLLCSCKRKSNINIAAASEMLEKLIQFLLRTQICSENKKFHGAWMRSFDMINKEYYGCSKDFSWGPYCILVGWVTGAIPLVFLHLLGKETMYGTF